MTLGHPNSERLPAPDRISEANTGRQLASHTDAMPYTKESRDYWKNAFSEGLKRQLPHGFANPTIHGDGGTKHHAGDVGAKQHAGLGDRKHHPNSQYAEPGDRKHHPNGDHAPNGDGKHHYRSQHDQESRSARAGHQRQGHDEMSQHLAGKGGHGSFGGRMSWYGEPQGMANGHRFNPEAYTVASKTLPLGSHIRIHSHGRSVDATVTDRGPYVHGRNLDVSRRIARELGFTNKGVTDYSAEVLSYGSGGRHRHRQA